MRLRSSQGHDTRTRVSANLPGSESTTTVKADMASTDNITLEQLRPGEGRPRSTDSNNSLGEQVVHTDSVQDIPWQPSRSYQCALLLAGFTMIFHVIGLNSIYGIFQVCRPLHIPETALLTPNRFQEFYTSPSTNIKGAQGQDALVSLVGTLGTCLTWSGSIFVNPLVARAKYVQPIMLIGLVIMSLGICLASFSTKVRTWVLSSLRYIT